MSFDANLNIGKASDYSMNNAAPQDFSDWYQNEQSLDLANFMSDSRNLELCSDDLFQNLFPSNSPLGADLKKNHLDFNDQEVENFWCPNIEPISACSSTAPSPTTVNFYNTPPVTPQPERQRVSSPHSLQFDGLTTTMSTSRFASLRPEDIHGNIHGNVHNAQNNLNSAPETHMLAVKQEHDPEMHMLPVSVPIKTEVNENVSSVPSTSFADSLKRHATSNSSITQKKSKAPPKGTLEYLEKRKRNNVAVRRSRDKAKMKAVETQQKVEELSRENETLHKRVAELTHELVTLKKLLQALPQM